MNKTKIRKLIKYLEGVPAKKIDMFEWLQKKKGCGTVGCIAGHTILMEGLKPVWRDVDSSSSKLWDENTFMSAEFCKNGESLTIEEKATEILGLDEPDKVFFECYWPKEYFDEYQEAIENKDPETAKEVVIDRLKHLLKTGE